MLPVTASLLDALGQASGASALLAMALALVLGCLGVPVPEEAVHATAGWLAEQGRVSLTAAWLTGWLVLVMLDLALFELGRRVGPRVRHSRWGRRVAPGRWRVAREFVRRRGGWAVGSARFLMGVRIPIFVLAGVLGMPRRRFLAVVVPLGVVSSGVPLWLGYVFARELPRVIGALGSARWVLVVLALVLLLLWVTLSVWRRSTRARMRAGAHAAPVDGP